MGGGGLFGTAPDYMAFLQMLLNDGTLNGAQVLKPETVATMRQNQMGDLKVVTLRTTQPDVSKDANFFPQMDHDWGLSFDINTEPGPHGRECRQPLLGGAVQHLLLGRPEGARRRHDHDANPALRGRRR